MAAQQKSIVLFIICQLLLVPKLCDEENKYITLTYTYPPHTYKIGCQAGEYLYVKAQWSSEINLRACLIKNGTQLFTQQCLASFQSSSGHNLQFSFSILQTSIYFLRIDQLTSNEISRVDYNISYSTSNSSEIYVDGNQQHARLSSSYSKRQTASDLQSPLKYKASGSANIGALDLLKFTTKFISPSDIVATFVSKNSQELCILTLVAETGVWLVTLQVEGIFAFVYDVFVFTMQIIKVTQQYCFEDDTKIYTLLLLMLAVVISF